MNGWAFHRIRDVLPASDSHRLHCADGGGAQLRPQIAAARAGGVLRGVQAPTTIWAARDRCEPKLCQRPLGLGGVPPAHRLGGLVHALHGRRECAPVPHHQAAAPGAVSYGGTWPLSSDRRTDMRCVL